MSTTHDHDELFIGGEFVAASTSNRFIQINPATEEPVGSVPDGGEVDVDRAVAAARQAFITWGQTTGVERGQALNRLADAFAVRSPEIADLIAIQNGAPRWWVEQDVRITVAVYRNAAKKAAEIVTEEVLPGGTNGTVVRREPLGVVAAIAPWNTPQALLAMKVAAALAAGCTIVAKPSPETSLDSYLLAEAAKDAGLAAGVLNIVTGGADTGKVLVGHPGVDHVSFTGSTESGRAIATAVAQSFKSITAELGGKSAAVVLEDADLDTLKAAVASRFIPFSGQVCHALTRVIIPRSRQDEVLEALVEAVQAMPVGDPTNPETLVGPLATAGQRDRVEEYLSVGSKEGAKLVIGGGRPAGLDRGYYVEPTIFADVTPDMRIFQEEIFGPVLSVSVYDTEDEAVALHDATDFGLSGAVFGENIEHATDFARRLRTGEVLINGRHAAPNVDLVRSFYKHSSIGGGMDLIPVYQLIKSIPRS